MLSHTDEGVSSVGKPSEGRYSNNLLRQFHTPKTSSGCTWVASGRVSSSGRSTAARLPPGTRWP